jgi:hypothetical protein
MRSARRTLNLSASRPQLTAPASAGAAVRRARGAGSAVRLARFLACARP